jgi:hypothetical protein
MCEKHEKISPFPPAARVVEVEATVDQAERLLDQLGVNLPKSE